MEFDLHRGPPSQCDICQAQNAIKKKLILFSIRVFSPLLLFIFVSIRVAQNYTHDLPVALGIFIFMILIVVLVIHAVFEPRVAIFKKNQYRLSTISRSAIYYTLSMCRQHIPLEEYRKEVEKTRDLTFGEYLMMKKWTENVYKKSIEPFLAIEHLENKQTMTGQPLYVFQRVQEKPVAERLPVIICLEIDSGLFQGYMAF